MICIAEIHIYNCMLICIYLHIYFIMRSLLILYSDEVYCTVLSIFNVM